MNRSVISKKEVKIVRPVGRKIDRRLDGKEDKRGIYLGSFEKMNGEMRSMEFVYSKDKIQEMVKNGEMIKVKEIIGGERGNLEFQWRYFNCGKMIGDLIQVN